MIQGPQAAIAALQTHLETELPAQVLSVNNDVTDGVYIADPLHVYDYMPAIGQLTDFPIIGIEHGKLRWEDDTGFDATAILDVAVVAFVNHPDPQGLARRVRRYQTAILRTLDQTRSLGFGSGVPWGVQMTGADFGPALERRMPTSDDPPQTFMTYTVVGLRLKYDES